MRKGRPLPRSRGRSAAGSVAPGGAQAPAGSLAGGGGVDPLAGAGAPVPAQVPVHLAAHRPAESRRIPLCPAKSRRLRLRPARSARRSGVRPRLTGYAGSHPAQVGLLSESGFRGWPRDWLPLADIFPSAPTLNVCCQRRQLHGFGRRNGACLAGQIRGFCPIGQLCGATPGGEWQLSHCKEWRTRHDSNVRPLPSEGSALSS